MHDTIGCYLDLDGGQISFSKNGIVSGNVLLFNSEGKCTIYQDYLPPCLSIVPSGNDLGVAFDIPQHVKNQPFFASCVLKVEHQPLRTDTDDCYFHMNVS